MSLWRLAQEVADKALELCHFGSDTGEERRQAAATDRGLRSCLLQCLMTYSNQSESRAP